MTSPAGIRFLLRLGIVMEFEPALQLIFEHLQYRQIAAIRFNSKFPPWTKPRAGLGSRTMEEYNIAKQVKWSLHKSVGPCNWVCKPKDLLGKCL